MGDLDRDGFAVIPELLSADDVAFWADRFSEPVRAGRRNLLDDPEVRRLSDDPRIHRFVGDARVVRGILFDKTPEANWAVPPHQDLNIALAERYEVDGFGPWSSKSDVVHAIPPIEILLGMITIRIGIDPCGSDNGPLRVVPGTHRGKIPEADLPSGPFVDCTHDAGGAVLMRPLIVHASLRAAKANRRRVIHLEYASIDLPPPLGWAFAV